MPSKEIPNFSDARNQKRQVFQSRWNRWIAGPLCLILLVLLSGAQILFFVFSGNFIRFQAISLDFIREDHRLWVWGLIALGQVLCSAPGFVFLLGLWKICRKTRWQQDTIPDVSGIRLMKISNSVLCIVTGIFLFLYPTCIVTAGEYLNEAELFRLFYLLLSSSLLFFLLFCLVRPVLRQAEENITCCWTKTGLSPLLILLLFAAGGAFLKLFPLSNLFTVAAAALCILYGLFLLNYWVFLRKIAFTHAAIDQNTIAKLENFEDPYSRY